MPTVGCGAVRGCHPNPSTHLSTPPSTPQLLRHPLTQRRIGVLARALELASLPMVLLQAAAPPGVLSPVGDVLQPGRLVWAAECFMPARVRCTGASSAPA